jgi:hypothetical protein
MRQPDTVLPEQKQSLETRSASADEDLNTRSDIDDVNSEQTPTEVIDTGMR